MNSFICTGSSAVPVPHDCLKHFVKMFLLHAMRCKPSGRHLISVACLHSYLITCLRRKHNFTTIITWLTHTCLTKEKMRLWVPHSFSILFPLHLCFSIPLSLKKASWQRPSAAWWALLCTGPSFCSFQNVPWMKIIWAQRLLFQALCTRKEQCHSTL